jgi:EmrB/QacA subfamily drug resistance transporter
MHTSEIDYNRKWFVLAAVSMGIFLSTIDSSIVNIALPTLIREYGTNFQTVQWVVLVYLLTLATLLLSIGRLGDMKGKKPIYTAGFVIFTIGSFLCGLAPTIYLLIAFRVIQAIGATMILALGMAIVIEAFPTRERGMALGITGTMVSIGIVIGPTVGGLIIDALSWNWIFFVNLPIGILGILMVIQFVPSVQPSGKQRFDIFGAGTLFLCLLTFSLAMTLGQSYGFNDPRIITLFAACIMFMIAFLYIENHIDQPMIDLSLFRNMTFSISLITGFITFIAIGGTMILMPFYLENGLGYSTREVGMLIAAVPITMGVVAPLAGSMSDRFGSKIITVIGLGILLIGYIGLSTLRVTTSTIGYLLRFMPIGIGMGVFLSPNNSSIMGVAPRDRLGIVSGMLAENRTLGQTTGIAALGAIWASRVFFYTDAPTINNATDAPIHAQVTALQDSILIIVLLIMFAFGLAIFNMVKNRQHASSFTTIETEPANPE